MAGRAHRGRRCRLEHDSPARRRGRGRRDRARRQGAGAPLARRGDRAQRRRVRRRASPPQRRRSRKLCGVARRGGVESLDVFLTAPGTAERQRRRARRRAARAAAALRARALDRGGGTARLRRRRRDGGRRRCRDAIAVCDVGGASTEIAVGSPRVAPELGRARSTSAPSGSPRASTDPAEAAARGGAGVRVGRAAARSRPRSPSAAARAPRAGSSAPGSARTSSPRRCASSRRGRQQAISRRFGVHRTRARILPAGLALLAEVQQPARRAAARVRRRHPRGRRARLRRRSSPPRASRAARGRARTWSSARSVSRSSPAQLVDLVVRR